MKALKPITFLIWAVLLCIGCWGVYLRLFHGHHDANYGSYVPWGLWISVYVYFIGLSAGTFIIASLGGILSNPLWKRLRRPALLVAFVTLLGGLLCVWFDLGHMERNINVFLRPNFTSMMTWVVWLYNVYAIFLLIQIWLEMRFDFAERAKNGSALYRLLCLGWQPPADPQAREQALQAKERIFRVFSIIAFPLAVAFNGGGGALFATLVARTYWHSGLFPVLFLAGALLSGSALIYMLVSWDDIANLNDEERQNIISMMRKFVGIAILTDLVLEAIELLTPLWYGVGEDVALYKVVLFGQYWYVFWIFHLLLGSIIPLLIIFSGTRSRLVNGFAGFLVAAMFMAVRLNLVIPGQITPALKGLQDAYIDSRLRFAYIPSAMEWAVVAFVVAGVLTLYVVGKWILPVNANQSEKLEA